MSIQHYKLSKEIPNPVETTAEETRNLHVQAVQHASQRMSDLLQTPQQAYTTATTDGEEGSHTHFQSSRDY